MRFPNPMSDSHKKINNWLKQVIAKPRKKIGGHAVCPYLSDYWEKTMLVETTTPENVVEGFRHFKHIFNLEAVVVNGFDWEYDYMHQQIDLWNKRYRKHDVICLGMHPDTEQEPLGFAYTYTHEPLIIIQRISTLKNSRLQLKETDYYTYFNRKTK
jgi:hypothetical protein